MHQRNDSRRESIPARKYLAPFTHTRSFSLHGNTIHPVCSILRLVFVVFFFQFPSRGPWPRVFDASFEFRRSPRQHRTERDSGAIRSFHPCDRDFYGRTGATRKRRETGTVRRREQNLECENSRSMNRSEARSSIVAIVVVRIQVRGGYISADVRSARS